MAGSADTPHRDSGTGLDQVKVRAYYDAKVDDEWTRVERHRMELAVSLRAVSAALPERPCRVLDIGGGPGRYSLALSQAGHEVTLFDLSPANVEFARKVTDGRLAGYHVGTATDLGVFPDGSSDAVLLMGPLYHLLDPADRERAIAEACRVLAPGGILAASFITVYAFFRDMAKFDPEEAPTWFPDPSEAATWVSDGRWSAGPNSAFTDAWFARPSVVRPLMERGSGGQLECLDLLAAEGIIDMIEEKVNELEGPLWAWWVDLNYALCRDESLLGGCGHMLYIGKKVG